MGDFKNYLTKDKEEIDKESLNEEYIELMESPKGMNIGEALDEVIGAWNRWAEGPMTKRSDIIPAKKELFKFVDKYLKKNIT